MIIKQATESLFFNIIHLVPLLKAFFSLPLAKEMLRGKIIISVLTVGPFTLAKTKIQKTWVFCCTVYTARKTHNIRGFWHEKHMREKTRISYLCFGKWCACATSLYLWPYTCSAHYVAGRGRVIPLKVTYHVTKNQNNTCEIGASVYIGKKPVKFRRSFKKSRCGGWVFDSGFLECLGEVA